MLIYTRQVGFHLPSAADSEISKLERLVTDLKAIRDGEAPTARELAAAPILDRYHHTLGTVPMLVGQATGHPRLPGMGRPIHTSQLWVYGNDVGWARTYSRWYRLGRPADAMCTRET